MSNDKQVKVLLAGSLRIPARCMSEQGESAPKVKLRGVADGEQVNIPVLVITAKE